MPKPVKTTGSQPRSEKTEVFLLMSMEIRMNGSLQIPFSGKNTGRIRNIRVSQTFLRLPEAITLRQWGEECMRVDAGGYINVTDKNNIYVISQRDFEDTYEIR